MKTPCILSFRGCISDSRHQKEDTKPIVWRRQEKTPGIKGENSKLLGKGKVVNSVKKYNVLSATLRIPPNPIFHQINLICSPYQIYLILSLSVAVYLWQKRTSSPQLRATIIRKASLYLLLLHWFSHLQHLPPMPLLTIFHPWCCCASIQLL